MYKHQKAVIRNFIFVTSLTIIIILSMLCFKDVTNRSESIRAMNHLSKVVLDYRQQSGSVPAESYIDNVRKSLEGYVRLGKIYYRARWVTFESSNDEILAYVIKEYTPFFLDDGAIVLRLDGRVEWLAKAEFESILADQQSAMELEVLGKN